MAALTITEANVLAGAGAKKLLVTAGSTITAGMALAKDTSTGRYGPSIADAADSAKCDGIALCGAANGQPLVIAVPTQGNIDLGATLEVGETYCVSWDAGGEIIPIGDITPESWVTIIGIATAADNLLMKRVESGVATPPA